jgi:hypothetical protein
MNYFAHGHQFVDNPYFLAGTAVPDWLRVVDRKARVRSRVAIHFVDDRDERLAALAAGVIQHHRDDEWFHRTRAFAELSLEFTTAIREQLDRDAGFRPSVLAHILVEILLDNTLIRQDPWRLRSYYQAIDSLDVEFVAQSVSDLATREPACLVGFIPLFSSERFLYDYADDAKLLFRLNQIMRRVKLPTIPEDFLAFLPRARERVAARAIELLKSN